MSTQASRRVDVRGCGTELRVTGAGAPVLFLRGFDVGFDCSPFIERLSKNFQVITPDHPGFGASDVHEFGNSVSDLAYFYLDLLDVLELPRVHIVGASIGGWIGAEIALRTQQRVASLTLIDPAGIRKKGVGVGDPFIKAPQVAAAMMVSDAAPIEKLQLPTESDADIDLQLKNRIALARITWHPRFANPDLRRWLHRISIPAHLIWGTQDKILPFAHSEIWTSQIPGLSFHPVDGAGHLPHIERPIDVADEVKSFIGRNTA